MELQNVFSKGFLTVNSFNYSPAMVDVYIKNGFDDLAWGLKDEEDSRGWVSIIQYRKGKIAYMGLLLDGYLNKSLIDHVKKRGFIGLNLVLTRAVYEDQLKKNKSGAYYKQEI